MPTADVTVRSPVPGTFRSAKVQGMFDVPRQQEQALSFHADLSRCDGEEWKVGAIVGASGRGKSTLARALWPAHYLAGSYEWQAGCLLDDFPQDLSVEEITSALTSVGFSSAPAWLRPYGVLSTGQRHRADLARGLLEARQAGMVVFDEFTSVVDRTVAKAASVAVARHVRRSGMKFVAVTCHRDVLPWLEADWYLDLDDGDGRLHWGRLQRPAIPLHIQEGARSAWHYFAPHHYLSTTLHKASRVFLAWVTLDGEEQLAGFFSLLPVAGHKGWWRGHRIVVLPDFQGLGIGNRMCEEIAEILWVRERKRYRVVTSAPGMAAHNRRHPEMWKLAQPPGMRPPKGRTGNIRSSAGRLTTGWIYLPQELRHRGEHANGDSKRASA